MGWVDSGILGPAGPGRIRYRPGRALLEGAGSRRNSRLGDCVGRSEGGADGRSRGLQPGRRTGFADQPDSDCPPGLARRCQPSVAYAAGPFGTTVLAPAPLPIPVSWCAIPGPREQHEHPTGRSTRGPESAQASPSRRAPETLEAVGPPRTCRGSDRPGRDSRLGRQHHRSLDRGLARAPGGGCQELGLDSRSGKEAFRSG